MHSHPTLPIRSTSLILILSVKKSCIKNPFQGLNNNLNILNLIDTLFGIGYFRFFYLKFFQFGDKNSRCW